MEQLIGNGETKIRVAVIETDLKHLESTVTEIKSDVKEIKESLIDLKLHILKDMDNIQKDVNGYIGSARKDIQVNIEEVKKDAKKDHDLLIKHDTNLKWLNKGTIGGGIGSLGAIAAAILSYLNGVPRG